MRILIAIPCLLVVACASSTPPATPSYGSVRERLAAEPTRLFLPAASNIGELDARRWSSSVGWVDGSATVSLANGELVAQLDPAGRLVASQFDFALDPIELPATIIGQPLVLRDVRAVLTIAPAPADVRWTNDDEGVATIPVELTLSWSLESNGGVTPLGDQKLAAIPTEITLVGGGDHVDATLGLHAAGTLWSWAELLELTKLDLTMDAATTD